jgi:hypothetical protein
MNIPIWPGSSSFVTGSTPFGYYDNDLQFKTDADKVAKFCAQRLGYPIMEVEMQDINFYTCFEEAITEFTTQVNMYNARDYMITVQGTSADANLSQRVISPNLGRIIKMAKNYGTEAGSGGTVTYHKGSIQTEINKQEYDLDAWAATNVSGSEIEIKRVYYEAPPAIIRYFDPFVGTGYGSQQLMDSFGWGSYSPSINFMLMPLYADLLRIQEIEFNDQIRKSAYSFELVNNNLRIFPMPDGNYLPKIYFDYILVDDRNNPFGEGSGSAGTTGRVSDLSNIPYDRIPYTDINHIGKQWIYKYTLAIAKELLGLIRGKYATIPVPGAEVTLNAADLITQASTDKAALLEELRLTLEALGRKGQMLQEQEISEAMRLQLSKVPLKIYIK